MTCSSMLFAKGPDYLGHWAEDPLKTGLIRGTYRAIRMGVLNLKMTLQGQSL